ncbi:SGNH hydrolase-type esterase domain-containing protein [Penicillium argentinense]|uniref:SGNH hydrolase-type esterase domain-containing protein n=1 Tax=Penicillium argentinense TaxID=1131581 RepID=A0A9W9G1B6_9EURO|nr:SGNH hydrolase-type esterase domain-containing protein [Penicillium argentinense]KAJ5110314.1 SGNH hydrolase-type esterase domain-containing protein [Penicillium argentinense]
MKAAQSLFLLCAATGMVMSRRTGSDYRFVGRVNPETKELTWASTGVAFTFTGTTASININSANGTSSVALFINDNGPIIIPNVNGTSISTPTISRGTHAVELRKRSESDFGTFRITDVTTDGTLVPSRAPKRKIEIIGDSISVGYGLDGIMPCNNSAILEDNPKTYGALAANAVDADYSVVAWSGKGLVRNYYRSTPPDQSPTMPVIYTRYGANDTDGSFTFPQSWVPDAVVINLGTNDFGYVGVRETVAPADLTAALVELMEKIHWHYPSAKFFLVSSPLLSDDYPTAADAQKTTQLRVYQDAADQLTNVPTRIVDWPAQGSDTGCSYHPNAATQAKGAALLEEAMRDEMGW